MEEIILLNAKRLILDEKYQEAKTLLLPLANNGDSSAQLILGYLYYGGDEDTTSDESEYWLSKSSANGNPEAMYYIATTNFEEGTSSNNAEQESSLRQVETAAKLGSAEAQRSLAVSYAHGEVVEQCDIKTMYWDEQAASQGLAESQNDLALMLLHGYVNKTPNIDKAIYWYEKSAAHDFNVPYAQWAAEQLAAIYEGQYSEKHIDQIKQNYWAQRATYLDTLDFRPHPDWFYNDL